MADLAVLQKVGSPLRLHHPGLPVLNGHKTGVNVLYGDQSVKWVPMSDGTVFKTEMYKCVGFGRTNNPSEAKIWKFFDEF
jgi:hypothetical protein